MAQKETRYKVTFRKARDIEAVLDMLRYEGSQVIAWDREDEFRITITLRSVGTLFVPDRWVSFGLYPKVEN